ncbi:hypothetical protein K2X40_05155 [Candidatus Babeliales bacterium]|nr:hypothetical protein [Candidatus Babeliales bacterium]
MNVSRLPIFMVLACLALTPCCRKRQQFEYAKKNKLSRRKIETAPATPPTSTEGVAAVLQPTAPAAMLDFTKTPTLIKKSPEKELPPEQPTIPALDHFLTTTHQTKEPIIPKKMVENDPMSLDFDVENQTGKTVYASCFVYMRKNVFSRWRWFKTDVYKIDDNQSATVNVETVADQDDRQHVFGMLGVFNTQLEAEEATYELTDERHILDLDLLAKLDGKKVTITVEQYGFKEPFYDYDFVKKNEARKDVPELDFYVLNNTGKSLYVCGFIYEKKAKGKWIAAIEDKDDMSVWRFDKTEVLLVKPNEKVFIDVDTILSERDRAYVRGYLAVFEEDEQQQALEATFELLESKNKLNVGDLVKIRQKTVVLDIKRYGISNDFIQYRVKPIRRIDMTKIPK